MEKREREGDKWRKKKTKSRKRRRKMKRRRKKKMKEEDKKIRKLYKPFGSSDGTNNPTFRQIK